jgi:hypothetical protein
MEVDDDTLQSTDDDVMSAPLNNRSTHSHSRFLVGRVGMSNSILPVTDPIGNAKLATDIMSVFPSIGYDPVCVSEGTLSTYFPLARCEWGVDKTSQALSLAKLSSGPSGQVFSDRAG